MAVFVFHALNEWIIFWSYPLSKIDFLNNDER